VREECELVLRVTTPPTETRIGGVGFNTATASDVSAWLAAAPVETVNEVLWSLVAQEKINGGHALTMRERDAARAQLAAMTERAERAEAAILLMPTADESVARARLFGDICRLLQLDPDRATADDVLRLVGAVVDRATEAERKRCDGCRHWRASLSRDPSGFCDRTESGCIMRPGDYCSRWEERR
jgi:hypothetical protein